jgi:hypothetical protein
MTPKKKKKIKLFVQKKTHEKWAVNLQPAVGETIVRV